MSVLIQAAPGTNLGLSLPRVYTLPVLPIQPTVYANHVFTSLVASSHSRVTNNTNVKPNTNTLTTPCSYEPFI